MKTSNLTINKLVNFLGWFILLLGIYAAVRTVFNLAYYKEYPLSIVFNPSPYYMEEEDCYQQYNYPIYEGPGQIRKPTLEEEKQRKAQIKICLEKVKKQREKAKVSDIWTSIFLLFLGSGILYTKRFYL